MKTKHCEYCGVELQPPAYRVTKAYLETRRFCSIKCRTAGMKGNRRSTFGVEKRSMADRFWSKVIRKGAKQCWLWTGANSLGYGFLAGTRGNASVYAHRLSYELHIGKIPSGLCVCHRCDNPQCVNPSHLFLGTRADNNVDRASKGRTADHVGEANPNSKLTTEDVVAIKKLRNSGMTQQKIADKFGIAQAHVSSIMRRKTWNKI